ncbi:MAG: outer membrane protein assembly factor BamB family protein [Methanobacteriota archaeon]
MDFPARPVAVAAALALVAVGIGSISLPASGLGSITIRILFDLGDGTAVWSDTDIPDREAPNATWDAIRAAARENEIALEYVEHPDFGVGIVDVGDRDPPAGFIGVYTWNRTAGAWASAEVGVSSLVLRAGDAIALYAAAYGPYPEVRYPIPTPDHPYPATQFRADLANRGASRSPGPVTGALAWDADTGAVEIAATPAVAYGRVYVNTMDAMITLDESSGEVIWRNPVVRGFSSPAVVNGTLIVGARDGRVYRVDAATGAVRWTTPLLGATDFSGITSSPKVDFDRAYVGTFNESGGPGEVVALSIANGSIVWRHATGSVHYSSPAIAGGTLYVGVMGTYNRTSGIDFDPPFGVLALDAADGSPRWFFQTPGSVAASPLVAGDVVVVPSKDSFGYGLVYAIDRATGDQRWRADVPAGVSSPALLGDAVVVAGGAFGGSGRVTALNRTTGGVLWTFEPNGPVQASVAAAAGTVYVSTNTAQGTVYALNATEGRLLWSFTPSPAQYILGSPVVADGALFAPSDNGHVYAFRDPPGPVTGFPAFLDPIVLIVLIVVVTTIAVAVVASVRRSRRA